MLEAAASVAFRLGKERDFRLRGRKIRLKGKKNPAERKGISGRRERKIRRYPQSHPKREGELTPSLLASRIPEKSKGFCRDQ